MNTSVIIPLYNGQAFIKRAMNSVFKQTRLPLELIVVDDASTDLSLEVVNEIRAVSPIPVKILRMEKNSGGPAKPLNKGVCEARGDLIAILDQDDYFSPEKLEALTAVLVGMPDVRLIFSDFVGPERFLSKIVGEGRDWLQDCLARQADPTKVLKIDSGLGIYTLLRYSNVSHSFSGTLFFRSDFLEKGGFDESLGMAADYDFICWITLRWSIAYVDQVYFYKESHGKNLSNHWLCDFEDSVVFLTYLWQAQAKRILRNDEELRKKVLQRWGTYTAKCRENKNLRAPLALNYDALWYFRVNFFGLKAMMRLWSDWMLNHCLSECKKF